MRTYSYELSIKIPDMVVSLSGIFDIYAKRYNIIETESAGNPAVPKHCLSAELVQQGGREFA